MTNTRNTRVVQTNILTHTLSDSGFTWATNLSRTRLSSIDDLTLRTNPSHGVISDLQGILRVVQSLEIERVSNNDLIELEFIAEGETFAVWKQQWKNQVVAVKRVKAKLLTSDPKDRIRRQLQSVLQEILVMNHGPVAGHPNIINLLGYGWQLEEGRPLPFMVVECGTMGSIRTFLQCHSPQLPIKHKAVLAGDIAAGLMTLHQSGIVHGDLKLDNIVLCPSTDRFPRYIAKLCDFGHSISLSTDDSTIHYYGTPLYLPPEALDQKKEPILRENLYRCDIWAFGLALWEVLVDGNRYFEDSWYSDPRYTKSTSSSWSLVENYQQPSVDDVLSLQSFGTELQRHQSDHWFANFDLAHLSKLSHQTLLKVCPTQSWERSYLGPLLRSSLNSDPSKRMSDLTRSPIMLNWYSAVPRDALQAKLAVHSRDSGNSFDLFRPDRQAVIPWEHQVYIRKDLEAITQVGNGEERSASAEFQLMICNAIGFGCDVDTKKAATNLRKAIDLRLEVAELFGNALMNAFTPSLELEALPYSERVKRGYSMQRQINIATSLRLHEHIDGMPPIEITDLGCTPRSLSSTLLQKAYEATGMSNTAIFTKTLLYSVNQCIGFSWLEYAILTGNIALLQRYWKAVPCENRNKIGAWKDTPLTLACRSGSFDLARELLSLSWDMITSNGQEDNAFHWLLCFGKDAVEFLNLLLKHFDQHLDFLIEINKQCSTVYTIDPLWPAEMTGTPLAFAVTSGNHALVEALLRHGANPQLVSTFKGSSGAQDIEWTPLHLAIKYNFPNIVRLLLDKSVTNDRNLDCQYLNLAESLSCLTCIERYGIHGGWAQDRLLETIKVLPEEVIKQPSKSGTTPLWQAIDYESFEVVDTLLEVYPELAAEPITDAVDEETWMFPLHYAVQISANRGSKGAITIPERILSVCAEALNLPDSQGRTALHFSVLTKSSAVTQWLLTMGSKVDARDFLGRTPLMMCRSAANTELLLEFGAHIQAVDKDGFNSAHHAVAKGVEDSLQVLTSKGINLDHVSRFQGAALHLAAAIASKKFVEKLYQSGAEINLKNFNGDTALHVAVAAKRYDVVSILMQCGADPTSLNSDQLSPLDIAILDIGKMHDSDMGDLLKGFEVMFSNYLKENKIKRTNFLSGVLLKCARYGGAQPMKFFLDHPAWVDTAEELAKPGIQSPNPLHIVVQAGRIEAAKVILAHGAGLNGQNVELHSLFVMVCSADYAEDLKVRFCSLLRSYSADQLASDDEMQTAWQIAHERAEYRVMCWLLNHTPKSYIGTMCSRVPLTWTLLETALSLGEGQFVGTCLLHTESIAFLADATAFEDIAAALHCDENEERVIGLLRSLIRDNIDLVNDALHGKNVGEQLVRRACISPDMKAKQLLTGKRDFHLPDVSKAPANWVSSGIKDYLDEHEPETGLKMQYFKLELKQISSDYRKELNRAYWDSHTKAYSQDWRWLHTKHSTIKEHA